MRPGGEGSFYWEGSAASRSGSKRSSRLANLAWRWGEEAEQDPQSSEPATAAAELVTRIGARLRPLVPTADQIEVRTLHALARQVLLDAAGEVRLLADRGPLLRAARCRAIAAAPPNAPPPPEASELDTILPPGRVEGRAPAPEAAETLRVYESLLAARGGLDFDDLVVRAARLLDEDPPLRDRWQSRFSHVLVDEFQDVDAAQLRLVRALAEPERNLFVAGDDDQP